MVAVKTRSMSLRLDAAKKQVIVGPRKKLLKSRIHIKEVNWLGEEAFGAHLDGTPIMVKTRSMRPPVPAKFTLVGNEIVIDLAEPMESIAPGQACVFYAANTPSHVLGGAWITKINLI